MKFDFDALIQNTTVEPRPYQSRIVTRAVNAYLPIDEGGKGLRSILIESATGSGKSAMGLLTIRAMQNLYPDLAVGWVCMRRNLLTQADSENKKFGIGADVDYISMFAKELPAKLLNAKRKMLVVDEAAHDAAASMAHMHSVVRADYILGMTAVPFRTDRQKLCFDTIIKDAGIGSLIRDGYLSQYKHYTIPEWDVKSVCRFYLNNRALWGERTIIYMHRVEHCEEVTEILRDNGVRVETVTGSTDREDQIDRFRTGDLDVLTNCMVLTEGLDVQNLATVFCRPSCKSVTIQMSGRAFRKYPGIAHKNIVQSKNSRWPFIKTVAPLESYVWEEDQWLSLTPNEKINEINCKVLVALAHIHTQLPAFILKKNLSKRGRSRRNRIDTT